MVNLKEELLRWIDGDRDKLVDFLSGFVQAKSPNPPGDTRAAAAYITGFLDKNELPYRIIAPREEMPNIVGSFECGASGRHLILNDHIDVFPVGDAVGWTYDPWSGTVDEGRIYGRGVVDPKCGTTAIIFTFAYLHRIREHLKGRLTLTCVSDEENGGVWGARYLVDHNIEVLGDCCLSGEATSPYALRFGEKGHLWLAFSVRTRGAHSGYPNLSSSATKIAALLICDLEKLAEIKVTTPEDVKDVLHRNARVIDKAYGRGAAEIAEKITINIGTIRGGLKVNMIPSECVFEADLRFPIGLSKELIMAEIGRILDRYPEVTMQELSYAGPAWCDPNGEMVKYIKANAKALNGYEPEPIISFGSTDTRFWRYRNVPAYVYGPVRLSVGSVDEHVEIDDFLHIVRTHVLSAYDYLSRDR